MGSTSDEPHAKKITDKLDEYGIKWDDEDLNISWRIPDPMVSNKDEQLPKLIDQTNLPIY